ncbi:CLUMA_CG006032, isoform A [Clunio marinus]|uniref:CLUMA_CG006032, isoform A n=1 Tax=Clunio marinus TaxID=568069 RepID=A0A1J1I0W8_9DIPT|nr:CLUMA_CG006032, isoform A [Clunio marinus]
MFPFTQNDVNINEKLQNYQQLMMNNQRNTVMNSNSLKFETPQGRSLVKTSEMHSNWTSENKNLLTAINHNLLATATSLNVNYFKQLGFTDQQIAQITAQFIANQCYADKIQNEVPPAEPKHRLTLYKKETKMWIYKDRTFSNYNEYLLHVKAHVKCQNDICALPFYNLSEDFNVPYGSSFPEYKIFKNFTFATPKINPIAYYNFNNFKILTENEYKDIRADFDANGRDVTELQKKFDNIQFFSNDDSDNFSPFVTEQQLTDLWKLDEISSQLSNTNETSSIQGSLSKRASRRSSDFCIFCKNNEEDEKVYMSHTLKDFKGRTLCPKLRLYKCPICGIDGDNAHTMAYCPRNINNIDKASFKKNEKKKKKKGSSHRPPKRQQKKSEFKQFK